MAKHQWQLVKFGDVVRQVKDKVDPETAGLERYIAGEHMDTDDLRIRRWGEINDDYLGPAFHMRFKPGQVLYGSRRTYLRKVAVPHFEGICANTTYVLEPKDPTVLLPELLPFIMQTERFHEHSIKQSKGSVNPYINFSDIAWYEFALPPLEEQRRITRLLLAATATKNEYHLLVDTTRTFWYSTAAGYFSEHGLAFDFGKCKGFRLGRFLEYSSDGPFGSKLKTKHYVDNGVQVIRLQNIDERKFNDSDKAYISESYFHDSLFGYEVKPGDVLIAGLGDERIRPGRACIAPENLDTAINKADCYCLRPNVDLSSRFLVCFLNSPYGLRQSASFSQGTTRYRLNLGNIRRMKVPVPSLQTQQEVADTLDELYEAEKSVQSRFLKQSEILHTLINSLL